MPSVHGETPRRRIIQMTPDIKEVWKAAKLIFTPGQVTELRVLDAGRFRTVSGYYHDKKKLARDCFALSLEEPFFPAIYWTLNPCNEDLFARCADKSERYAKQTTTDADILSYRWILVDCDPVRISGISSSDEEKKGARAVLNDVVDYLFSEGIDRFIVADSGNGYHILIPVDLPKEDSALVHRFIEALAKKFDTPAAKVDTKVFNQARICKAYGTVSRKGSDVPSRPHRMSKILKTSPEDFTHVPTDISLIGKIAGAAPVAVEKPKIDGGDWTPGKMEELLALAGIEHRGRMDHDGGIKWQLGKCIGNDVDPDAAHPAPDSFVKIHSSGARIYSCSHASCEGRDWKDAFRPWCEEKLRESGKAFSFGAPPLDVSDDAKLGVDESQFSVAAILRDCVVPANASVFSDKNAFSDGEYLSHLEAACTGKFGKMCKTAQADGMPLGWFEWSLVTAFAKRGVHVLDEWDDGRPTAKSSTHPVFYFALLGGSEKGKTAVFEYALAMAGLDPRIDLLLATMGSDKGLLQALYKPDKKGKATVEQGRYLLNYTSELGGTFTKMGYQGSCTEYVLTALWDKGYCGGNFDSKTLANLIEQNFSMAGGLVVNNKQDLKKFFGLMSREGLWGRFVLMLAETPVTWNNSKPFARREHLPVVVVNEKYWKAATAWKLALPDQEGGMRMAEHLLRCAVVIQAINSSGNTTEASFVIGGEFDGLPVEAAVNKQVHLGDEAFDAAKEMCTALYLVKSVYKAGQGRDDVHEATLALIEILKAEASASPKMYSDLLKEFNMYRDHKAISLRQARDSMASDGSLRYSDPSRKYCLGKDDEGKAIWESGTGLIRWLGGM